MSSTSETLILRIYVSSSDRVSHQPLFEHLVFEARKKGMAGATALKGVMSYGASSVIHSYKFWETTDKVPVVVELIDEEGKILAFYEQIRPLLESMRYGCLVTVEPVRVLLSKPGSSRQSGL